MNPCRVKYITQALRAAEIIPDSLYQPLADLSPTSRFLDIGCGGGVFVESLLRLGLPPSSLTAIEPSSSLCDAMVTRLTTHDLITPESSLTVHNGPIESFPPPATLFTCITLLEVIEHIPPASRAAFLTHLTSLLAPGGMLFVSTIDRDFFSGYLRAVIGAEYIARVTPVGTHDYEWFPRPWEVAQMVRAADESVAMASASCMEPKHGLLGEVESYGINGQGGEWVTSEPVLNEEDLQSARSGWGNYIMAFRKASN